MKESRKHAAGLEARCSELSSAVAEVRQERHLMVSPNTLTLVTPERQVKKKAMKSSFWIMQVNVPLIY